MTLSLGFPGASLGVRPAEGAFLSPEVLETSFQACFFIYDMSLDRCCGTITLGTLRGLLVRYPGADTLSQKPEAPTMVSLFPAFRWDGFGVHGLLPQGW